LDCRIRKILLADCDWRAQTHHCSKFRYNRSFHCGDYDFSNFHNGRRRHLGFLKSPNFIDYWAAEDRDASVQNVVKIGQSVAKTLKYFDYSRWRRPPSGIIEFIKFYWLTVYLLLFSFFWYSVKLLHVSVLDLLCLCRPVCPHAHH